MAECALQDTAGVGKLNSGVMKYPGHLSIEQDELVVQQAPILTSCVYVTVFHPNDLPALMQDRDGWRDKLINARASSTENKIDEVLLNIIEIFKSELRRVLETGEISTLKYTSYKNTI